MNRPLDGATAPITKEVQVGLEPPDAFRLFTEGIDRWWPLRSHSLGEERAVSCVFEGRAGGRIYERLDDGSESEWGEVVTWEPPSRLVFTWHPGRARDTAQEVEVRFVATDDGTRVELVHRGWERLGDRARDIRPGYERGWDLVLGDGYVAAAGA